MLVDGKPATAIPADDRGLAYGDGLFETIEIRAGRPVLWDRHMQRLLAGCDRLAMQCNTATLLQETLQLAANCQHGIVKIIQTRGSGGRGYRPAADAPGRRIVSLHDWPDYPVDYVQKGIRLYNCRTPVSTNSLLAGLKTLCRLEQVLAQMEFDAETYQEGLMLDDQGYVIEGTRSNVFIVKDGILSTPALKNAGIKGIMREVLLLMAKHEAIRVNTPDLDHETFSNADEIFVCNSIIGIWPVTEYLGKSYTKGPVTELLTDIYNTRLSAYE